jgi:putative sigma-54 modulation protein
MIVEFENIPAGISENQVAVLDQKVKKLERFFENIVSTVVYLKEEASATHIVEIKMIVKDSTLFVKEEASSWEEATEKAVDVMARQLKKYKSRYDEK